MKKDTNFLASHEFDRTSIRSLCPTMMMLMFAMVALHGIPPTRGRLTCSKVLQQSRPQFHLLAPCSTSGMNIIARTNTTSAKRCSQFANLKTGLAFNFKRPEKKRTSPENCIVYDCPESDGLQSLRREKDFDYYTLFSNPMPPENAVCVVGVGMFRLHENRANYSEAAKVCSEEGGELASVLSTRRTIGLSAIVSNSKFDKGAYVGLNDIEREGKFMSTSGKPADCFEFKAWALGEPRARSENEDCVTVDGKGTWKVVDCTTELPFICELLPKGPFPFHDRNVKDVCKIDLSRKRFAGRVLKDKDFYKKYITFHWLSFSLLA